LEECVSAIVQAVKSTLEQTPPELSADILDKGIVMTGGGSQLRSLDERIRQETNLPVNVIDNPLQCVCMGTAKIVENLDHYRKVLLNSTR
jgi:rod shape-determining protein MreB